MLNHLFSTDQIKEAGNQSRIEKLCLFKTICLHFNFLFQLSFVLIHISKSLFLSNFIIAFIQRKQENKKHIKHFDNMCNHCNLTSGSRKILLVLKSTNKSCVC